jgi:hypothetical protein
VSSALLFLHPRVASHPQSWVSFSPSECHPSHPGGGGGRSKKEPMVNYSLSLLANTPPPAQRRRRHSSSEDDDHMDLVEKQQGVSETGQGSRRSQGTGPTPLQFTEPSTDEKDGLGSQKPTLKRNRAHLGGQCDGEFFFLKERRPNLKLTPRRPASSFWRSDSDNAIATSEKGESRRSVE